MSLLDDWQQRSAKEVVMSTPTDPRSQVAKLQYVAPTDEQTERIKACRQSYIDLCTQIENLIPDSHERSVAITNLRTAMFWTNAAIVLNGGRPESHAV
jgi:hypothetical protein